MTPAIRLLGAPALRNPHGWERLKPGKATAVLVFAAHRGGPVRRAEVAALLWPEMPDQRAHTNLRQVLASMAEGPVGPLLARDRTTIYTTARTDLQAFEAAVREGQWEAAVGLYGGPFVAGLEGVNAGEFGEWVASERTAVERRWRRCCLKVIGLAHGSGRYDRALELAEQLLAADALDEVALRHAMLAEAASGDPRAAEQRFAAYEELLLLETGLQPDPATVELAQRLRVTPRPALAGVMPAPDASGMGPRAPPATTLTALAPRVSRPDRLVGRDVEFAALVESLCRADTRLLTLLAPGGMGKTTLAAAVVDQAATAFENGVMVAVLDGLTGPDAVLHAVVGAANLSLSPGAPPLMQLTDALAPRRALLLLDGFEAHLDQVLVVDALVRHCPHLTILVTSRSRLGLSTEQVVELGPLELELGEAACAQHSPGDPPAASPAARLFLRLASQVPQQAPFGPAEIATAERICRVVGGTPLAIELAAAWLDVLTLEEIEEQVARSWELLKSDSADRPGSRTDLRATIETTFSHLGPQERSAWLRLSILPGTVGRAEAANLAGTGWRGLRRLIDHGIMRHRDDRLEMHSLIARFGRERVAALGGEDAAWEALLHLWCPRVATEVEPGTGKRTRLHPHDLAHAMAAYRWAVEHGRWEEVADMTIGLYRTTLRAGRLRELTPTLQVAVRRLNEERAHDKVRARALARLLPLTPAPVDQRMDNSLEALRLARRTKDDNAAGIALAALVAFDQVTDVDRRFAQARRAFEAARDPVGMAQLALNRGELVGLLGRTAESEELLTEARDTFEALGDRISQAEAMDIAVLGPMLRGDAEGVRRLVAEARQLFIAEGDHYRGSGVLGTEYWLALVVGDKETAIAKGEAFLAQEEKLGDVTVTAALVRGSIGARFLDHAEAVAQSRVLLDRVGEERTSLLAVLFNQTSARSLVALGDLPAAARHLALTVRMTRELNAPRFVARVALTAGALATALGRREDARTLLSHCRHHPVFEPEYAEDLRQCLAAVGVDHEPPRPEPWLDGEELLDLAATLAATASSGAGN